MRVDSVLLTYSMVQSPSWEANWFAASQEIPRILRNPKVHYRTHKCPPPVPIVKQLDPVHNPTSHFLKIHLNIILPSTPGSSKWSLSEYVLASFIKIYRSAETWNLHVCSICINKIYRSVETWHLHVCRICITQFWLKSAGLQKPGIYMSVVSVLIKSTGL